MCDWAVDQRARAFNELIQFRHRWPRRVGTIFKGYTSSNGVDWVQNGLNEQLYPASANFLLEATVHNNDERTNRVLAAMLLPASSRAKAKAQAAECFYDLRNLGQATYMYAIDFQDWIPRDTFGTRLFFANRFAPYVGGPPIIPQRETDAAYLYDIYKKMRSYQCPSLPEKPGNQDFVLDYTINSIDWRRHAVTRQYTGAIQTSKWSEAPGGPSIVLSMTELNAGPGTPLTPRGFDTWDLWNPTLTTFNERGAINPSPRLIHAKDRDTSATPRLCFSMATMRNVRSAPMPRPSRCSTLCIADPHGPPAQVSNATKEVLLRYDVRAT